MSFSEVAHIKEEQKFIRELTSYLLLLSEKQILQEVTYRDMSTALLTRKHQLEVEYENINKLNN